MKLIVWERNFERIYVILVCGKEEGETHSISQNRSGFTTETNWNLSDLPKLKLCFSREVERRCSRLMPLPRPYLQHVTSCIGVAASGTLSVTKAHAGPPYISRTAVTSCSPEFSMCPQSNCKGDQEDRHSSGNPTHEQMDTFSQQLATAHWFQKSKHQKILEYPNYLKKNLHRP